MKFERASPAQARVPVGSLAECRGGGKLTLLRAAARGLAVMRRESGWGEHRVQKRSFDFDGHDRCLTVVVSRTSRGVCADGYAQRPSGPQCPLSLYLWALSCFFIERRVFVLSGAPVAARSGAHYRTRSDGAPHQSRRSTTW